MLTLLLCSAAAAVSPPADTACPMEPPAGSLVRARQQQRPKGLPAWSNCPLRYCPSSAPVPPQGAPGSSGELSTPRVRPSRWVPSHHRGCSRQPPPKPTISPLLTIQALPIALASAVTTPLWAAVYVGAEASEALTRVWNAALDQHQQQHGT